MCSDTVKWDALGTTLQCLRVCCDVTDTVVGSVSASVLRSLTCMHHLRSLIVELTYSDYDGMEEHEPHPIRLLPLPPSITQLHLIKHEDCSAVHVLELDCSKVASSLSSLQFLRALQIEVDFSMQTSSLWEAFRQLTALTELKVESEESLRLPTREEAFQGPTRLFPEC